MNIERSFNRSFVRYMYQSSRFAFRFFDFLSLSFSRWLSVLLDFSMQFDSLESNRVHWLAMLNLNEIPQ